MSEPITLRDHRFPCDHGWRLTHRYDGPITESARTPADPHPEPLDDCPGGRERTFEFLDECCTRCGSECDDHATGVYREVSDE